MPKLFAGMSGCALILLLGGTAAAQATSEREKALAAEIEQLKKIISEEQKVLADCLTRLEALEEAKERAKEEQEKAEAEKVKFKGDFRYRYETIRQDHDDPLLPGVRGPLMGASEDDRRDRHRIRLRLGAEYALGPEVGVVAQIASAMGGDPVSHNQTLTGGFSKKDMWIDLAYFNYRPQRAPGLELFGGKMPNPFYTPGGTQLIWDTDLTPEGLSAVYMLPGEPWEFAGAAGYFQVDERDVDRDAHLWALQGSVKCNLLNHASLLGGATYYDYSGAEGYPPFFAPENNFGNSLGLAVINGLGLYADDFDIVELFFEFAYPLGKYPLTLYADYVLNTAADDRFFVTGDEDTGWAAGITLGRCVEPHSWGLRYEYRVVERDAVVGAFTDSDFGGGGTNARGHIFQAEYMLLKDVRLVTTCFATENQGSDLIRLLPVWGSAEKIDGNYRRLQFDVNFKF